MKIPGLWWRDTCQTFSIYKDLKSRPDVFMRLLDYYACWEWRRFLRRNAGEIILKTFSSVNFDISILLKPLKRNSKRRTVHTAPKMFFLSTYLKLWFFLNSLCIEDILPQFYILPFLQWHCDSFVVFIKSLIWWEDLVSQHTADCMLCLDCF